MAVIRLRNSAAPAGKMVMVTTALQLIADKDQSGEERWYFVLSTDEADVNGNQITDIFVDLADAGDTLDSLVAEGLKTISAQVVWEDLTDDISPPILVSASHTSGSSNVSAGKDVMFVIEDALPSAGIDTSTIKLVVNDVDVTDDLIITGDPRRYEIVWQPLRLLI